MSKFTIKYFVEIEYETLETDSYFDTRELKDYLQNSIEHCRQENMLTEQYDLSCNWVATDTIKVDR